MVQFMIQENSEQNDSGSRQPQLASLEHFEPATQRQRANEEQKKEELKITRQNDEEIEDIERNKHQLEDLL